MSLPEIWIRHQPDADPDEFDEEDAAAIRAGNKCAYDICVIKPRTEANWNSPGDWEVLDWYGNYIGAPGNSDVYLHPQRVPDEFLRFFATDMWIYACGIKPGSLFRSGDRVYVVMGLECIPFELDPIGYGTGYLVCRSTAGGPLVRMSPEHATRRVLELNA